MIPIKNQILFKPFVSEGITQGGLYVPDSCKEFTDKGAIVAVGRGTKKKPMKLQVGMIAHRVHKWGQEIMIDNETYFLMDSDAILAVE